MCVVLNFELPVVLVASYQTRVERLNYFSLVAAGISSDYIYVMFYHWAQIHTALS